MVRYNEDQDNSKQQHDDKNQGGDREGMSAFSSLRHLRSSLCADRDRLFGDHQVLRAVEEWREFFARVTA